MKLETTCQLLAGSLFLLGTSAVSATTTFVQTPNAAAGGSWDIFSFPPPPPPGPPIVVTAGTSGSQGSVQASFGPTPITTSELTTTVIDDYDAPPGDFLGDPDTYYIHNGGFQWTASIELGSLVNFARVSYSLVQAGGEFGSIPTITGATLLDSGLYTDPNSADTNIYYYDFELAAPTASIESTFGDALFPGFPGSFRSIDAVQVEGFTSTPEAIPEPSTGLLASLAGGLLLLGRRRRRDS